MQTHKWIFNATKVIEAIPTENRASEMSLDNDKSSLVQTLGILWNAKDDVFTFTSQCIEKECKLTKRNFLKKIATLFDPLGILSPYVIRGKMLMQDI